MMKRTLLIVALTFFSISSSSTAQEMSPTPVDDIRIPSECTYTFWSAFSPDSTRILIQGCTYGWLYSWRIGMGYDDSTFSNGSPVLGNFLDELSFNSDSTLMLSHGRFTQAWEVGQLQAAPDLPRYGPGASTGAAFARGGTSVLVLSPFGVAEYETSTGEHMRDVGPQTTDLKEVRRTFALSRDGSMFAVGTDSGNVWIYDYATGDEITHIQRFRRIDGLQFSPDGSRLLMVAVKFVDGSGFLELLEYDVQTGDRLWTYNGTSRIGFNSARYDRTGRLIVATSQDSTVKVIDNRTHDVLAEISYDGLPLWAEFSAGGSQIVLTGSVGTEVWNLNPVSSVSDPVANERNDIAATIAPNPVHDELEITVTSTKRSTLRLEIHDAAGRLVDVVTDHGYGPGDLRITHDVSSLPPGVYTLTVRADGSMSTRSFRVMR